MTAKHRKGKGNHKHEEDNFKTEVSDSEVRAGGNSSTLVFLLWLFVVLGGSIGSWLCYQQHLTLSRLTDSFTSMQMKVAKLQSQESLRQNSDKVHVSDGLESRLNALEESYTQAQKQVAEALATADQLKTSDLPAQVLSLHTEMKSRLADIQQTAVSAEQLSQLQVALLEKTEQFNGVRLQLEGLSQQVQAVTGHLEEADAKLDEVAPLKDTLQEQAAQLLDLKLQLGSYKTQLEANTAEMVTLRELLPNEHSQLVDMKEQINAVRISIQDQKSAAQTLHLDLRAQLDNVQRQVTEMVGNDYATSEQTKGEQAPVVVEEAIEEAESNLVDAQPESDEPSDQALPSPEMVQTDASHAEEEEPIVEELVDDDDNEQEKEVAVEENVGQKEEDEGIFDSEENEVDYPEEL
ncbi:uncharacterized protein zgc:66479 isoform X3 [Nerophis ophidion]|uniref:uncharacterized protein zgc:66479 isoform X3 n=1 Tax=Nerophis ophidion TaxID=159077 RepID=UPI002AE02FB1|nr:uncharacterized protein zgc:66479 isoform X3 [Nerophis ophidion]